MMRSFTPARFSRTAPEAFQSEAMAVRPVTESYALRHRREQGHLPHQPNRFARTETADKSDLPDFRPSLDVRVQHWEAAARSRFFDLVAELQPGRTSGWLTRELDDRFLPALAKIGFDEELTRSLITLAAPAWAGMGKPPASGIRIHPELSRAIEETRAGKRAEFQRRSESRTHFDGFRPNELYRLASRGAEPATLPVLFENITTSWLILPRAYRTLTANDALCLPIYLNRLSTESDPFFRKTLTRVVIEYIGNFTLKYRRESLPREKTAAALFSGFTAMFWKNLRQPPAGCHEENICNHFFHWAHRLCRATRRPCAPMDRTAARMSSVLHLIFPQADAFDRIPVCRRYQPQVSLMALRHGRSGSAAALRCLGPSASLYKNATACRIAYTRVPACLQALLRTLRRQWKTESSATHDNIRGFLIRLAERYRFAWKSACAADRPVAPVLRFIAPRTEEMVHPFIASLP